MQIAEILKDVPLFALLEDVELARVAGLATVKGYLAGMPLFGAGDASDSFYVIARGRVQIRLPAQPGVEERKISLGAGKFFGEMGVVSGTPRTGDAVIEEDAVLVRIAQGAFDNLMAIDEHISEKVMGAYMNRAAETEEMRDATRKSIADPKGLLFYSAGGGAGASFLVANTALKIRDLTRKAVLVLDLDVQAPTQHLYLGAPADEAGGLPKVLAAEALTPALVKEHAKQLHFGVDILGGPGVPDMARATPERLVALFQACLKAYDFVVADTTSALNRATEQLFRAADAVHLVFAPEIVSVSRAIPVVRWFKEQGMDAKLRLVLNKFYPEEGFSPGAIEQKFSRPVLGRVEYEPQLAMGAVNEGLPLVKRNPRSTAAVDLTRFARQVVSLPTGLAEGERPFSLWNLFG